MNYIFKLVSVLVLISAILISILPGASADLSGEDAFFIVTAYYSPLPGQSRYATGTYAGDRKLNGPGVVTASGKAVFEGLLAAPKGYDYGTKIYFKGLGIGQVEDRGGAIVRSGVRGYEHDRIDIWMGYGDEGLNRAIRWGKRTIEGKVVDGNSDVSLKLGKTFLGKYGGLTVGPDSPELDILKIQELFIDVDLYSGEIDGKYDSVKDAIIDFQIGAGIIDSRNHDEAGYFGNKSRTALRETFSFTPLIQEPEELYNGAVAPAPLTQEQKTIIRYDGLEVSPESGKDEIKKLQMLMSEVGLYKGEIDGLYDNISGPLLNFQIGAGVVNDKNGWGAGYYGEKTRKALFEFFRDKSYVAPAKEIDGFSTDMSLSLQETKELDELIDTLKKEVAKIAKKKNTSSAKILTQLSNRIDTLLERNIKLKLKSKLIYIQNNI